jgi:hypothetical protein
MRILPEHPSQIVLSDFLPHILQICSVCVGRSGALLLASISDPLSFFVAKPQIIEDFLTHYIAKRYNCTARKGERIVETINNMGSLVGNDCQAGIALR